MSGSSKLECPNAPLAIETQEIDGDALLKLSGRLDMNSSPQFRTAAITLCGQRHCRRLTIDFGGVDYIDTSGLATLLEILVKARKQCRRLTFSGLSEKVRSLIDINGLTEFFEIEHSGQER